MSQRQFILWVTAIIALHWIIMGLFAFDIIPQTTKRADTLFFFHHGGDNYDYLAQTRALADGRVIESRVPIGYAILLVPPYILLGQPTHDVLVPPIATFSSLILFPISVLLLAWITLKITKSRFQALLTSFIYVLLPLIFFGTFTLIWNAYMAEIIAIHSTWAQMLTDGPTSFLSLLIVALFMFTRDRNYPMWLIGLIGLLIGFLGTVRLTGVLVGTGIGLVLLLDRQWINTGILIITTAIGNLPQLAYNAALFGNPLTTGYDQLAFQDEYGLFHPIYLWDALLIMWDDFGVALIIVLILMLIAIGISLYALTKHHWAYALIIGGWLLSYVALYSIYSHSWRGAMMRFMIPVEAPASLFAVVLLMQLKTWFIPPQAEDRAINTDTETA